MTRSTLTLAGAALILVACSASGDATDGPSGTGGTTGSGASNSGGQGTGGGLFGGSGGSTQPTGIGEIQGTVLAPEGTIPISGALVYLTPTQPEPIPNGVYCDRCVELEDTTPHTFSNADGSFVLPVFSEGDQLLVVQKGAFRRVRPINAKAGDQSVGADLTTLPGAMDKANGDDIPKMLVIDGAWDDIEDTLEKLGMQNGSFELTFASALNDAGKLSQYHIVFTPCDSPGNYCEYTNASDSGVQSKLQDYVQAGGKLYVTDYSYDYIKQTWPEYVDWMDDDGSAGSACMSGSYDAPAIVEDQGMKDWLAAQGITSFNVEENWTMVDKVNAVSTTDVDGNPTTITPKTWVTAQTGSQGNRPATLSFEKGCGRVLFSTYHTEGTGSGSLLPQEKALLYVLLEVAVCVGTPIAK